MILVPVKNLANAKQRLAPVLDQAGRTQLAQAMLADVLETLAAWANPAEVAVVSSDPYAQELARQFDFQIIPDGANTGETEAIAMAVGVCTSQGAESVCVIPADIPLMQVRELEAIAQSAPTEGSVLAPAADGRGTNAAWQRPAGLFPLRFGNDSFRPHLASAQATGKPCVVLSLPGIALDVDTPADLMRLAAARGETRAGQLARKWDFGGLPLAVNQ